MHFDELQPGMVICAGRWFHLDPERARSSRWQGLIASGWLTCSIAMRLAVTAVLQDSGSIGSPGIERIRWPAPVRPGDELTLRMQVLASRRSRSRSMGIVRWRWELTTTAGTSVLELVATSLFELEG